MRSHRGRRQVWLGGTTLALLVGAALAIPWLAGLDPYVTDLAARLEPPTAAHPFGRDALGRDLLARLCVGGRLSLFVAASAVGTALVLGVVVGAVAGWRGGWVDGVVARVIDVFLAFPGLLLAIALAAMLGPSMRNVVLALAAFGWTGYARLTRAQVAATKRREFVEGAHALGTSGAAIVRRHVLPAAAPLLLVQATFGLSATVVAEASLSFLGLGTSPPTPSWGGILDEGRLFMLVAPHAIVAPAAVLALAVLALQVLGDGLRDRLDIAAAGRDAR
jgi:peptide/nickel transport system permease protein